MTGVTTKNTKRRVLALVSEIDPYELAVRLAEAEMGTRRPAGMTPRQILDGQTEEFRMTALKMARVAAEYITECINGSRAPS